MRELTKGEREFLESLIEIKTVESNGYIYFLKDKKRYKRSRVFMQLHLNKKLEMWECIHHKNRIKTEDSIENLEIMQREQHTSLHHAGQKHYKV